MQATAATHVGRVRTLNEDAYLTRPALAVVADGMGGHASGDVASRLAVAAFSPLSVELLSAGDVLAAVADANDAILQEASLHPEKTGMGTTVTGVALVDQGGSPHWLVFNVGDSRVYRVENGSLSQLTVDHSEVGELIEAGMLTREGARTHPLRNIVTRSLGTEPAPAPDTWLVPATRSDVFLICSDGLTGELDDVRIATILAGARGLQEAADALVEAAVAAGGRDNVTVVLVTGDADTAPGSSGSSGSSGDEGNQTRPRAAIADGRA